MAVRRPAELHQPSGRSGLGLALASTTMLVWGVLPIALQVALRWLDAVTITWFRFGVSSLLLATWLASTRRFPDLGRLGRTGSALLAIATLGLAANYLAYLVGLDLTSAANAQVLIQLAPLLLALGGLVVFRERFTRLQWLGFAALLGGLGLFFGSQLRALATDLGRYLSGVGTLVVAALTWAVYGLAQKQLLRSLPSQGLMLCIYAGCFLCFSPWARPASVAALGPVSLGVLLFCALNTLVGYGAFAAALEHWEASRVSAILALTPLATLAFAALGTAWLPTWVAAERVPPASLLGAAVVVLGSGVVSLGGRRR
jgi:drug/metabolite transporter (DMT)-like permease